MAVQLDLESLRVAKPAGLQLSSRLQHHLQACQGLARLQVWLGVAETDLEVNLFFRTADLMYSHICWWNYTCIPFVMRTCKVNFRSG